jgi:hypothetical protein
MLYPRLVAALEDGLKGIGEPRFADSPRTLRLGVFTAKKALFGIPEALRLSATLRRPAGSTVPHDARHRSCI